MYPPSLSPEEEAALLNSVGTQEYVPAGGGRDLYSLQPGPHYVAPVEDMNQLLYQMQYGLENRQMPMEGLFGGGDRHYPPAQ